MQTSRGLGVLHLFGKVTEQFNPAAMAGVINHAQREADTLPRPGLHDSVVESAPYAIPAPQIITVEILGHKADLGFMILDYDFWRLRSIQTFGRAWWLIPKLSPLDLRDNPVVHLAGGKSCQTDLRV